MSHISPIHIFAAILTLSLASAQAAEPGLDVNDVSILFSLNPAQTAIYPDVRLRENGANHLPLLNSSILEKEILPFSAAHNGRQIEGEPDYQQWQIAGLRYDPCFPDPSQPLEKCIQQIRLIVQPHPDQGLGMEDLAMHLLYQVGSGAPQAGDPIIASLRSIQAASRKNGTETVGQVLGVHPALKKEATLGKGPVGDLVKQFIKTFCRSDRLKEITFVDSQRGDNWTFFHGLMNDGKWTPAPISGLDPGTIVQETDDSSNISPTASDSAPFGLKLILQRNTPSADLSKRISDELLNVENPFRSNPQNVDCGSCHRSSSFIAHSWTVDFSSAASYVNPVGITGFAEFDSQPDQFGDEVRNFGYVGPHAIISTLVANSSAVVADFINHGRGTYTGQGWDNPSRQDCSSWLVRACFASQTVSDKKMSGKSSDCLALCHFR